MIVMSLYPVDIFIYTLNQFIIFINTRIVLKLLIDHRMYINN